MRLDHLTDKERATRALLYEPRGFTVGKTDSALLYAAALAVAIQAELTSAAVIPTHHVVGRDVVDTNWGDVLEWIADAKKDEDDLAILRSIKLTRDQADLLDDFADALVYVSKGVTTAGAAKFDMRGMTSAEKREHNARQKEIREAKRLAKENGIPFEAPEDAQDEITIKGVTVVVCDTCDEFIYVPNSYSAKKCTSTLGCEGETHKTPVAERMMTSAARAAAHKAVASARDRLADAEEALEEVTEQIERLGSKAEISDEIKVRGKVEPRTITLRRKHEEVIAQVEKARKSLSTAERKATRALREERIEQRRQDRGEYTR